MFDKTFYQQVFDLSVDYKRLADFCREMDEKKQFDTDNAFEKYYDVNYIINAIDAYQNKKIDGYYLASWMCVYLWILDAGYCDEKIWDDGFSQIIHYKITDTIDSLAFFDDEEDSGYFNLDVYKQEFLFLDKLYKNQMVCQNFAYCFEGDDDCDEYVKGLMINEKEKNYVIVYTDLFEDDVVSLQLQDKKEFDEQIAKLANKGYKQVKSPYIIEYEKFLSEIE